MENTLLLRIHERAQRKYIQEDIEPHSWVMEQCTCHQFKVSIFGNSHRDVTLVVWKEEKMANCGER